MAIGPKFSGHSASPLPRQHSNTKRSRSLPGLPASRRLYTPTSSIISTLGTSHAHSKIPTPMTSRESSSSPPLKPPSKPSSCLSSPDTQATKIRGQESLSSGKVKGKTTIASRAHGNIMPVLHISKSSLSLIRDTDQGYDFGLPMGHHINHPSSRNVDNDKLDRMIEENCAPLRKELASVTKDLQDIKSRVAALEANHKVMQKGDLQPEIVAEPQTARQKEKSPQMDSQPLIHPSTSETVQAIQVIAESSKVGERINNTYEASSDVQDTIMKLREENRKLRNKNRELEEKLRAHRPKSVELIHTQDEAKAAAENEQFQSSVQQFESSPMNLDQEASGPSHPRGSGQNGDSISQQESSPPQQVCFEMIQRLSQQQEPFEDTPHPDDMVTEVHTNQEINEPQVQGTATGNDPPIEAGFVQHGHIITQQHIPPGQVYGGSSVPAQNAADERSNEVSRLCETVIVRVHPGRARRRRHHDMNIQEERISQTRASRRYRHHRSSREERCLGDPRRSHRSHRRHRHRSAWWRSRKDRNKTRHHRVDGDRRMPLFVRYCPLAERMFFPDEYRRI